MHRKGTSTTIAKILHKRRVFEESNPRYLIEKSIQDLHKLERYYVDVAYRNSLRSANYLSSEYFELEYILKREERVKERLSLPALLS